MSDRIRTLTQALAEEPASLAFLELGELLRQQALYDAAHRVARTGVQRHPQLADAHDLLARVLVDRGLPEQAFEAWANALEVAPQHPGATRGIAFLYFQAGDVERAADFLARAVALDPADEGARRALERLRPAGVPAAPAEGGGAGVEGGGPALGSLAARGARAPLEEAPAAGEGAVLADGQGLRLAGDVRRADGTSAGDAVAAQLGAVAREAARAAQHVGLGAWAHVAVETADGLLYVAAPGTESVLLVQRAAGTPLGRVALEVERLAAEVRDWLGGPA